MAISDEWWGRWWEADYSWEGLAKKPWEGWYVDKAWVEGEPFVPVPEDERVAGVDYRDATLQDYWRRAGCADHLVQMPDSETRFTLMHLPPQWRDGTATAKIDPENIPAGLEELLKAELGREIKDTVFEDGWRLNGADHRLQWQGVVLPTFSLSDLSPQTQDKNDRIPVPIIADQAAFSGYASFRSAAFSGYAYFGSAAFSGNAYFGSAAFSGNANFISAAFSGDASFRSAAFSGYASFGSAAFSGYANFISAAFSGNADFGSAAFSGNANFISAAFSGDAYFRSAAFSGYAYFGSAAFSGNANFSSAAFSGYAYFDSAAFSGNADFDSAAFSGDADFDSAAFLSDAVFSGKGNSVTSDAVRADIKPNLGVEGALTYTQAEAISWTAQRSFPNASFRNVVFFATARFDNRDFHSQASFAGAVFLQQAVFHSSDLHRGLHFRDTDFGFALNRDFSALNVRRPARGTRWVRLKHWVKDRFFRETRPIFRQDQFVRSILAARRRFFQSDKRRAKVEGGEVPRWHDWKRKFAAKLKEDRDTFQNASDVQKNAYYAEAEDCFRTLKHKMEDRRDRVQEGRFFRLELLARRRRKNDPHVPSWEEATSLIYQGASNFGTSFVQPLGLLLFVLIPAFAFIYWAMMLLPYLFGNGEGVAASWATWGEVLGYSIGRVLPFGPWGDPDACSVMGQMLDPLNSIEVEACKENSGFTERAFGGGTPIGLRVVASFQSVMALVLVFLSGLAIRRRFQIN